jgi:3-hydroxybutyryl-CoA dehydratase
LDQLYLDDFKPGERFEGEARVLDEAAFAAFAGLSGDAHPIHYDAVYARASRFGERVAHGLLLASMTALGATSLSPRLRDSMVAFAGQGLRFLRPVLLGESVQPRFTVDAVDRPRGRLRFKLELLNLTRGEVAAEGFQDYVLKTRG